MLKALITVVSLGFGAAGCGNSPSYALPAPPSPSAPPAASFIAAMRCSALDLGSYDDKVCLLGAISGRLESYAAAAALAGGGVLDAASATGCPAASNATSGFELGTSLALFVDGNRHWQLTANGLDADDLTAIVQCQPWSALGLGGAPAFSRVDIRVTACAPENTCANVIACGPSCTTTACGVIGDGCGGVVDCGPCAPADGGVSSLYPGDPGLANDAGPTWQQNAPVPPDAACVLSAVEGDLFGGASARVSASGLFASAGIAYAGGPEVLNVSATCFAGVTFADVALATNAAVSLPNGLCGIASLGNMNAPAAEVSVLGSSASTVTAAATARCLLYSAASP